MAWFQAARGAHDTKCHLKLPPNVGFEGVDPRRRLRETSSRKNHSFGDGQIAEERTWPWRRQDASRIVQTHWAISHSCLRPVLCNIQDRSESPRRRFDTHMTNPRCSFTIALAPVRLDVEESRSTPMYQSIPFRHAEGSRWRKVQRGMYTYSVHGHTSSSFACFPRQPLYLGMKMLPVEISC